MDLGLILGLIGLIGFSAYRVSGKVEAIGFKGLGFR